MTTQSKRANTMTTQSKLPTPKTNLPAPVAPAVPAVPAVQGIDEYLNRNPTMSIGRIMQPNGKDGKIYYGDDGAEVPPGVAYTVLGDSIWVGWARLVEGEAPQHKGGFPFSDDTFRRPGRGELGDADPTQWPLSKFDNQPTDPWKECVLVPLEDGSSGELFTLRVQSRPGSAAISATDGLLRHCRQLAKRQPDVFPVIKIKMGTYESRKYGPQWKPVYQIVGRTPKTSVTAPDTSIAADMNDEVGF
jgi:hypothetical protein